MHSNSWILYIRLQKYVDVPFFRHSDRLCRNGGREWVLPPKNVFLPPVRLKGEPQQASHTSLRSRMLAGTKIRVLKKSVAMKIRNPKDIPVTKEFEELVNIEDLRRGDYVLTRDEHTDEIYILTLQSGEKIEPPGSRSSPLAGLRFARRRLCKARRNHSFRVMKSGGNNRDCLISKKIQNTKVHRRIHFSIRLSGLSFTKRSLIYSF